MAGRAAATMLVLLLATTCAAMCVDAPVCTVCDCQSSSLVCATALPCPAQWSAAGVFRDVVVSSFLDVLETGAFAGLQLRSEATL